MFTLAGGQLLSSTCHMAWLAKDFGGLLFSIICSFYGQRVLVALQRVQVATILCWVVVMT